jgi:hypothetical protein
VKLPNKSTVLPSMTGEAVTYKGANGIGATGFVTGSAAKDEAPRVSAARRKERERGDFME